MIGIRLEVVRTGKISGGAMIIVVKRRRNRGV
nr:MAG TPA: hypothetical protein [Caudoviricetes sp.]